MDPHRGEMLAVVVGNISLPIAVLTGVVFSAAAEVSTTAGQAVL
jgi:hypothetical protein